MKLSLPACFGWFFCMAMLSASAGQVVVETDVGKSIGPVKPVNGVGQPPMIGQLADWSMMHYLKEAGIPYSRLHDVGGWLGGGLYVDIPNLFPDFDADENDPGSYRFVYTDSLIKALVENGVEPFFRLGVTIENFVEKGYPPVNSLPPKDYAKWARVAEHVIRHYTEGWADGFRYKISYWEIWNEPENQPEPEKNTMWRGTFEEYMRFYGIVAPHLKAKFPHLKIGGYGSCGFYAGVGSERVAAANSSPRMQYFLDCANKFLVATRDNGWPLDFFSFHSYSAPGEAMRQVRFADELLSRYGFGPDKCERIFNEWLPSPWLGVLGTAKQAADVAAELIALQNGPCDIACIYDARCSHGQYSPLFNPLTQKPHKAYYAFTAFNELRKIGSAVRCTSSDPAVYATAAAGNGRFALMVANPSGRDVEVEFKGLPAECACRIADAERTDETVPVPKMLPAHSFAVITGALHQASHDASHAKPAACETKVCDETRPANLRESYPVWHFPISRPHAGPVLGNTSTGLMLWGEGETLMLSIGRPRFWCHDGGAEWNESQRYERIVDALTRRDEKMLGEMFPKGGEWPSVMPFGRLEIRLPEGVSLRSARLDVKRAVICVALSDGRAFDVGMDWDTGTLVVDLAAFGESTVKAVPAWHAKRCRDEFEKRGAEPPTVAADGFEQTLPHDSGAALAFVRKDGVLFASCAETLKKARNVASSVASMGARAVLERTRKRWSRFWERSPKVNIPNATLMRAYEYGLFKFGSATSSEKESVAAPLQGPWYEDCQPPPWCGDYHFNINVQECYWPAYRCNHVDHLIPLFDMIRGWMPRLRANAKAFVGINDGVMLPHAVTDRGVALSTEWWTGMMDHGATMWVADMMWQYYRYSGDREFLEKDGIPFMDGAFNVLWKMLAREKDGALSIPIAPSPEYRGADIDACGRNPSFQLAAAHRLAGDLVEAAKALGREVSPRWREVLEKLPEATTRGEGWRREIEIWEGLVIEESHRHHSPLAAVFPFDTIDCESAEWRDVVARSYDTWQKRGMGMWSGWCVPWASILQSRVGNGDAAELLLEIWDRAFCNEGHNTLHNPAFTGISQMGLWSGIMTPPPSDRLVDDDSNTEIMQLEASGAAVEAVVEMLVHDKQGVLQLFKGAPSSWRDCSFEGVLAPGGVMVSARRIDGEVQEVVLQAGRNAANVRIANPWAAGRTIEVLLEETERIALTKNTQSKISASKGGREDGLFGAVVDARYGKDVRDEILADAERAFRTHFDDDKDRKAENVVWHDGPDGKKIPYLDGWISPEMGAWQGEFWGKYMLAGAEVAESRNDDELKQWLAENAVRFVREFRQSDGYICSYADRDFLGGPKDPRHDFAWNIWGRKYTMWALLEIARVCSQPELVEVVAGMADQMIAQLSKSGLALRETGAFAGMPSCSILIVYVRLYRATGRREYLDFARSIVADWDRADGAIPNLVGNAFSGRPVHDWYPKPEQWAKSYEMMSCLEGIVEYAETVGGAEGARLLDAVTRVRDLLVRHETNRLGSVGDGDKFTGRQNEYNNGTELCDVVYWMRLNAALRRATGDEKAPALIEKAFRGAFLPGIRDGGRWCVQLVKADGTDVPAPLQVDMKRHHCCVDNMPRGFVTARHAGILLAPGF